MTVPGTPGGVKGAATGEPTGAATGEPTGAATGEPTGAATGEPTGAATGEPTGAATGEPTGAAAAEEPTGAATGEPAGAAAGEPTGAAAEEPTGVATGEPTGAAAAEEPTGAATGEPAGAATGEPTGAATGEPTGTATGEPTGAATGEPTGAAVAEEPTGAATGEPTGATTEEPTGAVSSSNGASDDFQGQTPPPESSLHSDVVVNGIADGKGLPCRSQAEGTEAEDSSLPLLAPLMVAARTESGHALPPTTPPTTPPATPPAKPPRVPEVNTDIVLPPNAPQEIPPDAGCAEEREGTTASPSGESADQSKCGLGTEETTPDSLKHASLNEEAGSSRCIDVTSNEAPLTVLHAPNLSVDESASEPSIDSASFPSGACKLDDPQLPEVSAPCDDTNDSNLLPSPLSTSSHSLGSYRSLPRPSPARRSSRVGSVNLAQPSSMSNSYDGSERTMEEKGATAHSSHASSTVGGSLPSSPSIPRRTRRAHPVPAARSLQTLSSSPAKLTVAAERGAVSNVASYRKVSLPAKLNEPAREAPVPKPRKVSLNPFDSDEDNEEERRRQSAPREAPVPLPRKKVSMNPFESDDDDDEDNHEISGSSKKIKAIEAPKPAGTNPFDEDEEEEEASIWKVNPATGELEFKPTLSSSPATNSRSSSQSSITLQRFNDSIASLNAQLARSPHEPVSTNPFDEDEDDEFNDTGLSRDSTRMSLSIGGSSPLQRDGVRCSLPPSTRNRVSRKKRPAPLPPGQRPPIPSAAPLEPQCDHDVIPPGGSTGTPLQGSPRRVSTGSLHNLSVSPRMQSSRKPPPPRPPPPKLRSSSQTRN
ncbi:mucin-2-like isoform X1 [Penaeus indicus]|uniref:mucin-2-like isoform X1 n=1 Tax=Penaeus indicus TaxID=29960 RepID=UPI00300C040A